MNDLNLSPDPQMLLRKRTVRIADLGERYAFLDPASGKQKSIKRVSADSAICVGAPDAVGRIFILYAHAQRVATEDLFEWIYEINSRFAPRVFGCEGNAMQELFVGAVQREARIRSIKLPLIPVHQPTTVDKDWRIRAQLQPLVNTGRLLISSAHEKLREQINGFPLFERKDLIDACGSMCSLIPPRRLEVDKRREANQRSRWNDNDEGNKANQLNDGVNLWSPDLEANFEGYIRGSYTPPKHRQDNEIPFDSDGDFMTDLYGTETPDEESFGD